MSQIEKLHKHLQTHDHITALQAIGLYRIFNLKGRIFDLRTRLKNEGNTHTVETEMAHDGTGKTYARYRLVEVRTGEAERVA